MKSLKEVAKLAGLHPESILRGIREKRYNLTPIECPAYRAARKFFFADKEVREFCRWVAATKLY